MKYVKQRFNIFQKFFLASGIILLSLIVLGISSYISITYQKKIIGDVGENKFGHLAYISKLSRDILKLHSEFGRIVRSSAMGILSDKDKREAVFMLSRSVDSIKQLDWTGKVDLDPAEVQKIVSMLDRYTEWASSVNEVLWIDKNLASEYILRSDGNVRELILYVNLLGEKYEQELRRFFLDSERHFNRIVLTFLVIFIITATALVVLVCIVGRYIFFNANRLIHIIRQVTDRKILDDTPVMNSHDEMENLTSYVSRLTGKLKLYSENLESMVEKRTESLSKTNERLHQEINDRERIQWALEENQKRLVDMIDFLPDATFTINTQGKVIAWNRAIEHMTGIKARDILGKGDQAYSMPFYGKKRAVLIDLMFESNPDIEQTYDTFQKENDCLMGQSHILGANGKETWLWCKASPIYDIHGRVIGAVESIRDISDRKQAQKALHYSEEKFRSIFAQTPVGIEFYDSRPCLIDINSAGMEIFGISDINEIKDLPIFDYAHFPASAKDGMHKNETLRFEMHYDYDEVRKTRRFKTSKTGKAVLDVIVSPLGGNLNETVEGWLVLFQDITRRKRSENQIHNLTRRLLKARENERQRISRDLHDSVAQDLSTLKIGLETLYDGRTDINRFTRNRISGMSEILQKTIRSVRELSYNLLPPSLENLGLVQAVNQYCEDFSEYTGIRTEVGAAGLDDIRLDFDTEINLYRLLQEALSNVRKHAYAQNVLIKLVASYPNLIMRIEDDGKGFEVEERIEISIDEKHMGLKSMEERVGLLDGIFRIQSGPEKGTRIFVEVPLNELLADPAYPVME